MLGDWVKSRGKIEQVRTVYDGYICTDSFEDSHDYYFEPILLTPEISEKNFPTAEELAWWPVEDGLHCELRNTEDIMVSGVFRFVHELQHAIRLCGIEKEIEL